MSRSVKICHYTAFHVAEILVAFLWDQIMRHYWLTCFFVPMRMNFLDKSFLENSTSHIVILMTLSLSIIKYLRNSISDNYQCTIHTQPVLALIFLQLGFLHFSLRIWIAVFLPLSVCLLLVYFISASGCHCVDLCS